MMEATRRAAVLIVAVTALLTTATVPAGALDGPATLDASGVDDASERDSERDPAAEMDRARHLVGTARDGSASATLRAVLAYQGHDAPPTAAEPATVPDGTPAELEAPLARLLGAVGTAETLRAEALADLTADDVRLIRQGLVRPGAAPTPADGASDAPALEDAPGVAVRTETLAPSGGLPAPDDRAEAVAARVDQARLRQAALVLVDAVEAAQPELAAAAEGPTMDHAGLPGHDEGGGAGPGAQSQCGVQGSVVFETSDCRVIVGDTGPNTYPPGVDPVLLVDLGGDDVYNNGAARANLNVRVVVDVSGDDTYAEAASVHGAGASATVRGQAFATLGAALLWDAGSGTDSYSVSAATTAPEPGPEAGGALAQGQGDAVAGAAVLVDAGGRNAFGLDARSSGGAAVATGQGSAIIGLGALLDLGALAGGGDADGFDDTRTAAATSTLHLVEDTGSRRIWTLGPGEVRAQGAGTLAGVGVLTDAGGPDLYEADVDAAIGLTVAQGAGFLGAGVLVDGTGDDVLRATAVGDARLEFVTTDPSFCWTVQVRVGVGETRAVAQGGATVGAGLLADGAGDDLRLIDAESSATAIAEAESDLTCTNTATAEAQSGPGTALGQGAGNLGAGVLVDLAGDDVEDLRAESRALARAIATSPGTNVEDADATAGEARTRGQGHARVGFGLIADALGQDEYASAVVSTATEETSAGTVTAPGPVAQEVQGWGMTGAGWLVELAGDDAYGTSPAGASLAADESCWSNAADGRGRDLEVPWNPLPAGCP